MKLRMVAATLVAIAGVAHAEIININDAELVRLQASGVPVIDVRTADEWRETGVIKGAPIATDCQAGAAGDFNLSKRASIGGGCRLLGSPAHQREDIQHHWWDEYLEI